MKANTKIALTNANLRILAYSKSHRNSVRSTVMLAIADLIFYMLQWCCSGLPRRMCPYQFPKPEIRKADNTVVNNKGATLQQMADEGRIPNMRGKFYPYTWTPHEDADRYGYHRDNMKIRKSANPYRIVDFLVFRFQVCKYLSNSFLIF